MAPDPKKQSENIILNNCKELLDYFRNSPLADRNPAIRAVQTIQTTVENESTLVSEKKKTIEQQCSIIRGEFEKERVYSVDGQYRQKKNLLNIEAALAQLPLLAQQADRLVAQNSAPSERNIKSNDSELQKAREQIQKLQDELLKARSDAERLKGQLVTANGDVSTAESLAEQRAREAEGLRGQLVTANGAVSTAESLAEQRAREAEGLRGQLATANGAISTAESLAEQRAREAEGLRGQLATANGAISTAESLAEQRAREAEELRGQLATANGAISTAESLAEQRAREAEGLRGQLATANGAISTAESLAEQRAREAEELRGQLATANELQIAKDTIIQQLQEQLKLVEKKLYVLENSKATQTDETSIEPTAPQKPSPTIALTQETTPQSTLTQDNPQLPKAQGASVLDRFAQFKSDSAGAGLIVNYGDELQSIKPHFKVEKIKNMFSENEKITALLNEEKIQPTGNPPDKIQFHENMDEDKIAAAVLILQGVSQSNKAEGKHIKATMSDFEEKDLLLILQQIHKNLNEELKKDEPDLEKINCVEIVYQGDNQYLKQLIEQHNTIAQKINSDKTSPKEKQTTQQSLINSIEEKLVATQSIEQQSSMSSRLRTPGK